MKEKHWEAATRRCSVKNVFLKLSKNSQENTCVILFFNKVAGLSAECSMTNFMIITMKIMFGCFSELINFKKQ